jgi:hypothetical protein
VVAQPGASQTRRRTVAATVLALVLPVQGGLAKDLADRAPIQQNPALTSAVHSDESLDCLAGRVIYG